MTVQEFADITLRVIAVGGFESHIPTALFPERDHLAALEGIPENGDVERATRTGRTKRPKAMKRISSHSRSTRHISR